MTEREQFESAMLESVIMPRPHLVAHIETIFERYDFGDCGYKQMWLDSAWIGWQAAKADSAAQVETLTFALENLRLFAARYRKEGWAQSILLICNTVGVTGSPLRDSEEPKP